MLVLAQVESLLRDNEYVDIAARHGEVFRVPASIILSPEEGVPCEFVWSSFEGE